MPAASLTLSKAGPIESCAVPGIACSSGAFGSSFDEPRVTCIYASGACARRREGQAVTNRGRFEDASTTAKRPSRPRETCDTGAAAASSSRSTAAVVDSDSSNPIRRLQKKLREIEAMLASGRPLNADEQIKAAQKPLFEEQLLLRAEAERNQRRFA